MIRYFKVLKRGMFKGKKHDSLKKNPIGEKFRFFKRVKGIARKISHLIHYFFVSVK